MNVSLTTAVGAIVTMSGMLFGQQGTPQFHRKPSAGMALLKQREQKEEGLREDLHLSRGYSLQACKRIVTMHDNAWDTTKALEEWQLSFWKVLVNAQLYPSDPYKAGRWGGRVLDNHIEYTLREFDYHERAENKGEDGDRFNIARIGFAVCDSPDDADIDRMYYIMRHFTHALVTEPGTFDDPNAVLGDACYHVGDQGLGFCRGNVVVEINVAPFERRDGRPWGLKVDKALQAKMVEAARKIDALLLQKMFSPEVRVQIKAAEQARRASQSQVP